MALQQAMAEPTTAPPANILALQRTAGNRAVSRLIQAKLTVGGAGDRYEQEADRVADQVMSSQASTATSADGRPAIQRQGEEEEIQTKPLAATITPVVQRQGEEEEIQTKALVQRQGEEEEIQTKALVQRQGEEEEIQTKALVQRQGEEEEIQTKPEGDGSFQAGRHLEKRLGDNKGAGSPLPGGVRSFMESRFGADFGGVRLHSGAESVQMNQEIRAQAFTHGQDIYLGRGAQGPGTDGGNRLLAHELTHVIQQRGAGDRIARWGAGKSGYGTPHTVISNLQYKAMEDPLWNDFGGTALTYLAEHSDHMDKRGGYLLPVGGYMAGQAITKSRGKGMYMGNQLSKKQAKKLLGGTDLNSGQQAIEDEKRKRAQMYDDAVGYNRNPAEAPNHAEGGMYRSTDGAAEDYARIDAYLNNAVAQWKAGDPRQSLFTLALGLHTAQDIGAHGHGAPGTGHDPRRFFAPPNEYAQKGWVYYETGEGNPQHPHMDFAFCDNMTDNAEGVPVAIEEGNAFLRRFRDAVSGGQRFVIRHGYSDPGWLKRNLRGAGRFFGGRGIIKTAPSPLSPFH